MNVLVCTNEYYPHGSGIANVAHAVVEEWRKNKIDVEICSPTGPDHFIETLNDCGYIGLLNFWEKANRFCRKIGGDYDFVWMHNPVLIRGPTMRNGLVTIHSTSYGRVIGKMHPLPLHIYYYIGSAIDRRSWIQLQNKGSNVFSAISDSVTHDLKELWIRNPHLIPNGVDTALFRKDGGKGVRERYGIPGDGILFIAVGRLTAVKMYDRLVRSFDVVQRALGNAWLLIAGGGELLEPTKELVSRMGVRNVVFAGPTPHEDLPEIS